MIEQSRTARTVCGDRVVGKARCTIRVCSSYSDHIWRVARRCDQTVRTIFCVAVIARGYHDYNSFVPRQLDRFAERVFVVRVCNAGAEREIDHFNIVCALECDRLLDARYYIILLTASL